MSQKTLVKEFQPILLDKHLAEAAGFLGKWEVL